MKFDDYNYAVSNPYILLGENKNEKNYLRIKGGYSDGQSQIVGKITKKALSQALLDKYEHQSMTSSMKELKNVPETQS